MDAKIDYLSFTIMVDVRGAGHSGELIQAVINALWDNQQAFAGYCEGLYGWKDGAARGHYGQSLFHPTTYTTIRFGGHANHILCEMPGTACQNARDAFCLSDIVVEASSRLTRLDLAVDIPGGVSPADFVAAGYNERFKSHASIVSAEGTTEYVGSMKSERFARVYMYAPPHPRAGVLRVEHVLRGDFAKSAAEQIDDGCTLTLASLCGNTWGWLAEDWKPDLMTDGKLHARRADRHEPGRLRWLYQVVIPAISKAAKEGLIDLDEFFEAVSAL